MKKRILSSLLSLVLLLGVVACAGDELPANTSDVEARETATQEESRANPAIDAESSAEDEIAETVPAEPTETPEPVLNLPLIINNNTVSLVGNTSFFIDNDGVAWRENAELLGDVRSIHLLSTHSSTLGTTHHGTFFIKEDNSLWAMGKNDSGQLGDGTGVNRNDAPVEVMQNVANLHTAGFCIFAVTTERELYAWGSISPGEILYAPEKLFDDVVMYYSSSNLALRSDGTLWFFDFSEGFREATPEKIQGSTSSVHVSVVTDASVNVSAFRDGDNVLWVNGESFEDILQYSGSLSDSSNDQTTYIVKTDNTLWGWGNNSDGQLGDGTKINRDEPVFIMDNVSTVPRRRPGNAGQYFLIDLDGNLWSWNSDDPTPQIIFENVLRIVGFRSIIGGSDYNYFLSDDGVYFSLRGSALLYTEIADNVKLPSTTIIE